MTGDNYNLGIKKLKVFNIEFETTRMKIFIIASSEIQRFSRNLTTSVTSVTFQSDLLEVGRTNRVTEASVTPQLVHELQN